MIVANHTDDEMALSGLWANRKDVRKVILWLNKTDTGANCSYDKDGNAFYPRADKVFEYRPVGLKSCSEAHINGSLYNLNTIGRSDPTLPRVSLTPTMTWTEADGRLVRVWKDSVSNRGSIINVGLGVSDVTASTTRNMINDVTLHPVKYGLPSNTLWTGLIGTSYYNHDGNSTKCDVYANPEHGRMQDGVARYSYPQIKGSKYLATCVADRMTKGTVTLPSNWKKAAYGSVTTGSVYIYFGGLYRGAPPVTTTKSGVFASTQAYWKG